MLLRNRTSRGFTWLGAGLLLAGCLGCQGTEAQATREVADDKQVLPTSADNAVARQSAHADAAVRGHDGQASREHRVSIDNFTFRPETLEVPAGTKVVWVNGDDVPHTVRSTEKLFRSGTLDTDDVFEREFSEPGIYEYYCGVHRHMSGKIVVK